MGREFHGYSLEDFTKKMRLTLHASGFYGKKMEVIPPEELLSNSSIPTKEYVFRATVPPWEKSKHLLEYQVRIYSGIDIETNESRAVGDDAVRLVLHHYQGQEWFSKIGKCYRLESLFDNVQRKLTDAFNRIKANDLKNYPPMSLKETLE